MSNVVEYPVWPARPADASFFTAGPSFTIGEIAREFGVTFRALRFYESRGLLSPQRDGPSRRYRQADRERLALILRGKKLGFTLDQIAGMIRDTAAGALDLTRQHCVEQINLLERKKRQIETALAELRLTYASQDDGHRRREL